MTTLTYSTLKKEEEKSMINDAAAVAAKNGRGQYTLVESRGVHDDDVASRQHRVIRA